MYGLGHLHTVRIGLKMVPRQAVLTYHTKEYKCITQKLHAVKTNSIRNEFLTEKEVETIDNVNISNFKCRIG